MQTIAKYIAKHGITSTAVPVSQNPNMHDKKWQAYHYLVTLSNAKGQTMVVHYSVGTGIVERAAKEKPLKSPKWRDYSGTSGQKPFSSSNLRSSWPNTLWGEEQRKSQERYLQEYAETTYKPDTVSVLGCLVSDASGIEFSPRFEDWATDLGYDTDSRKAYATFQTCLQQAAELRGFLGNAAFDELLNDTERM